MTWFLRESARSMSCRHTVIVTEAAGGFLWTFLLHLKSFDQLFLQLCRKRCSDSAFLDQWRCVRPLMTTTR